MFKNVAGLFGLIALVVWARTRPSRRKGEYQQMMDQYKHERGYVG